MNEQYSHPEPAPAVHTTLGEQALGLVEQLQQELDALREQLAWSNRLSQLGVLTAAMAHETNNLLVPIGSYAQLAKANPGNERLNQLALNAAITGTAKVAKLVESVVSLASPGNEKSEASCQVDAVVQEAIACMMPITKQHRIQVNTRVEPVCVAIDGLALEQVLVNLISNASQAMSDTPGKRQITIQSQQGDGVVTLHVNDTGPGIAQAVLDHIFEPFVTQRGSESDAAPTKTQPLETDPPASAPKTLGSGLGLSICKQLVESAGGQIALAEQQQQGASFEIKLLQGRGL